MSLSAICLLSNGFVDGARNGFGGVGVVVLVLVIVEEIAVLASGYQSAMIKYINGMGHLPASQASNSGAFLPPLQPPCPSSTSF